MNRRSSRSLRVENFLYEYDNLLSKWIPKNKYSTEDLFKSGVFYTCKRMAQKVNPVSFRLKFNNFWLNNWSSTYNNYSIYLQEDLAIRLYLVNVLNNLGYGVGNILIYRFYDKVFIKIVVRRLKILPKQSVYIPTFRAIKLYKFFKFKLFNYVLVNKFTVKAKNLYNPLFRKNDLSIINDVCYHSLANNSSNINISANTKLRNNVANILDVIFLKKLFKSSLNNDLSLSNSMFLYKQPTKMLIKHSLERFCKNKVFISIQETSWILESASLLLEHILNELRFSRNSFRNVLTGIFKDINELRNVKGIRVNCSGRLSKTTTMAQTEWFRIGQIPLTTLTAKVDYALGNVKTKTGLCGVKVWIYYN